MGIGRDSANFAKRGIMNFISFIFFLALFVGILYVGHKFFMANYAVDGRYNPLLGLGLVIADWLFCSTLGRYIDEVLLKRG